MRFKFLNHWFIDDNRLMISLMHYYVDIKITLRDGIPIFNLRVFDDNKARLSFSFDTLESAIAFTEDIVNMNYDITLDDIENIYNEQYRDKIIKKIK